MKIRKKMLEGAVLALVGVGLSAPAMTSFAADQGVDCKGANTCKGKGACGGQGWSCAGKNPCCSKGWISAKSDDECKKLQAAAAKACAEKSKAKKKS